MVDMTLLMCVTWQKGLLIPVIREDRASVIFFQIDSSKSAKFLICCMR